MFKDDFAATADPLSKTLMKMKLKAFLNVALDLAGAWVFEFPAYDVFRFNVLQKGEVWLSAAGRSYHLKAGDCFLITPGTSFAIASSASAKKKTSIETLFKNIENSVAVFNGGGESFLIGTIIEFEGHLPKILFNRLPPVIHVPAASEAASIMRWSLERFGLEFRGQSAGRSLFLNHLTPIMFLQTLRVYLATAKNDKNWLAAVSDPKLSKVLEALHGDYQRDWSLEEMAKTAGMSRSGFALTFKKRVGLSPMDYLTHWRMQMACELLQNGGGSLSAIASAVGYESESAFSVAFKKIVKVRPGAYQRDHLQT